MSVILQFPKTSAARREPDDRLLAAEVIIFPGVRFERPNFELAQSALSGRQRRASQAAIDEDLN